MVKVNKEKCIGCGLCVSLCPDVFEIGEDGKSQIISGADFDKNEKCVKEAREGCPVSAVEI
jgi:ferredoxin